MAEIVATVLITIALTGLAILAAFYIYGIRKLKQAIEASPHELGVNSVEETAENIITVKRPEGAEHADTIVH